MSENETPEIIGIGDKLRSARQEKNLSLRQLASKAEVSASLLSQIENGKANPSVRSLYSIAEALSVSVDYFFQTTEKDEETVGTENSVTTELTASEMRIRQTEGLDSTAVFIRKEGTEVAGPILRADERSTIELQGDITWQRLTAEAEENIEFLEITYRVGASSGTKMSRHPGREFGIILEGELLLELGFEKYHLQPGDSIIFNSTTPHRLSNPGQVPVKAMWVVMEMEY